jgi:hypothetical protein
MMRNCWIGLGLACWAWSGVAETRVSEGRMQTGPLTWEVDPSGTLTTQQWPVESLMKVRMGTPEGRVMGNDPFAQPSQALPELQYESDRVTSMLGVLEQAGGTKVPFTVQRSVVFDAKRQAIRVLDVVSSSQDADQEVLISYETLWRQNAGMQVATPREFFVGKPGSSAGAMAAVIGSTEAPILMFIYGSQERGWARKVEATGRGMTWTYSGLLRAKQRVVLLHWVALTKDAQTQTVKQVRESLVDEKGLPAGARVDDQVLKELVNFPMGAEPAADGFSPGDLPLVIQLAEALKIERDFAADHAVMAGVPLLKGDFSASDILLESESGEKRLELAQVAAVQGGAGIGRQARVFLRDGTVMTGSLRWQEGAMKTESLGKVSVTPEALDVLMLRRSEDLDGRAQFAALLLTRSGEVKGLASVPAGSGRMRWPGGDMELPWAEIQSLRQLPLPDLGQEAWLKDGSRVRGWFATGEPLLADAVVYGRNWSAFKQAADAAKGNQEEAAPLPKEPYLRTAHDSLILGQWGQPTLALAGAAGQIEVPVGEIRSVQVKSGEGADSSVLELEVATTSGGVLRGAAVSEMMQWRRGGQVLSLPWRSIAEVVQLPGAATPTR